MPAALATQVRIEKDHKDCTITLVLQGGGGGGGGGGVGGGGKRHFKDNHSHLLTDLETMSGKTHMWHSLHVIQRK